MRQSHLPAAPLRSALGLACPLLLAWLGACQVTFAPPIPPKPTHKPVALSETPSNPEQAALVVPQDPNSTAPIQVDLGHGAPVPELGANYSAAVEAALAARPPAVPELQPLAWMAGRWASSSVGKGGVRLYREESYSAPAGNTLLGSFFECSDGQQTFTELVAIEATETGVKLSMRHFGPGLAIWKSEANTARKYRLTSTGPNEVVFEDSTASGHGILRYRRTGDRLVVRVENFDGTDGLEFEFQRVP